MLDNPSSLWYNRAMNIFAIEDTPSGEIDWHQSALSHDNFRVNKMIIESCQMLSTNAQLMGEQVRYRAAFQNHPSTIWARESSDNFRNLVSLAQSLRNEFCRRYNRDRHGCDDVIAQMQRLIDDPRFVSRFPQHTPTELPLCMPDEYKCGSVVESYRNFFANKPNLRYFDGDVPDWLYPFRGTTDGVILQESRSAEL